jgi:peptidoglycan hydrolase-like protein with peptidoglycan-binding domain
VALGYDPGKIDGDYGTSTTNAVIAFQKASGLTADGVVGPQTRAALRTALANL